MKRVQATLWVFLLVAILSQSAAAQGKGLSRRGRALKETWEELQRKPNDFATQRRYLAAFPHDYKTFFELFSPYKELDEEAHEFIRILPSLARVHEKEVGELLVRLSGDAHYEADATGDLQNATSTYGSQHIQTFVKELKNLPSGKQAQLIDFLADFENPGGFPEYRSIVDQLKRLGENAVAQKFEVAREKRARQPH